MRQRRSLRRSRSRSRAKLLERRPSQPAAAAARPARRGAGGRGGSAAVEARSSSGVLMGGFRLRRGSVGERRLGVAGRIPIHLPVALARPRSRVSRPRPQGPPTQRPVARLVGRAVDRAEDELAVAVEELAGLPVHLGRHVQRSGSGRRRPGRRSAARRRAPAARYCSTSKTQRPPRSASVGRGAQALRPARRRPVGSGMAQPASRAARRSSARRAAASKLVEGLVLVRAVAHADAGRAGVGGQLQVVRGVADHQRALGLDAELAPSARAASAGRAWRRSRRRCGWRRTCRCSSHAVAAPRRARGATCRWPRRASGCAPSAPAASRSVPSNSTISCWRAK